MHQRKNENWDLSLGWSSAKAVFAGLVATILLTITPPVSAAEIEIHGQQEAMSIRVEDASISDILDALATDFKVTYNHEPILGQAVSGTYSGTLHQVLARILDGNDYVANFSDDGVEIRIVGASRPILAPSPGQAIADARPIPPVGSPGIPTEPR